MLMVGEPGNKAHESFLVILTARTSIGKSVLFGASFRHIEIINL